MSNRIKAALAAAFSSAILAACAGNASVPVRPKETASVRVYINVPRSATSTFRKGRKYISPATQSLQINAQAFDTTPSSPNCTVQTSQLACAFTVDAPNLGNATFQITAYDLPLGPGGNVQGNVLAEGTTTATIVGGAANVVRATINGVPAQATIAVSNLTPPMGTAVTIPVTFDVRDAGGYSIIGAYAVPIALQVTTPSGYGGVQFISNGINGCCIEASSDTVTVSYSGTNVTTATLSASLNGQSVYTATFTPQRSFGPETPVQASLNGAEAVRTNDHVTWFTEPANKAVAMIPPGGTLRELPVQSGGTPLHFGTSSPNGLTLTESNDSIATLWYDPNINPGVNEIPLGVEGSQPFQAISMTGTVIVSEFGTGKIGVLTYGDPLAGGHGWTLTEHPTGRAGSTPAGLIYGGTGAIFADPGANAIGVFSIGSGTTQWYPAPSANAQPTRIAYACCGPYYYWFTEPGVNKVGRMDGNFNMTEFACSGTPVQIVPAETDILVLTSSGDIDDLDPSTGALTVITPPQSASGPVVAIGDGFTLGDLLVLRSNGTTGSVQDFYYH